jgi:hypothetical protein
MALVPTSVPAGAALVSTGRPRRRWTARTVGELGSRREDVPEAPLSAVRNGQQMLASHPLRIIFLRFSTRLRERSIPSSWRNR